MIIMIVHLYSFPLIRKILFFTLPSFLFVASPISTLGSSSILDFSATPFPPNVSFLPPKTAMNSKTHMKPSIVSSPSQTNHTVSSINAHSIKSAISKILALKIGNEINKGTNAPSIRRASFEILFNIFLFYSKKIPFEKYYRLQRSGAPIAIYETNSSNVFVIDHTTFEQNNF